MCPIYKTDYQMKKITFILFAIGLVYCSGAQADSFLTADDMPNAVNYLPAPPDTASQRFTSDWLSFTMVRQLRSGERGTQVRNDGTLNAVYLGRVFTGAMGTSITRRTTPELYTLLQKLITDCQQATQSIQSKYRRKPPFEQFKVNSMFPDQQKALSAKGSYASDYAAVGWATALILAEINVDRQDTILHRGYEYGESRVIAGVSYESDVDAGRVIGTGVVARLHADDAFMEQLQKAKDEFATVTGITPVRAYRPSLSDGTIYDLQGRRVNETHQGEIYINNGVKIRK